MVLISCSKNSRNLFPGKLNSGIGKCPKLFEREIKFPGHEKSSPGIEPGLESRYFLIPKLTVLVLTLSISTYYPKIKSLSTISYKDIEVVFIWDLTKNDILYMKIFQISHYSWSNLAFTSTGFMKILKRKYFNSWSSKNVGKFDSLENLCEILF